jgi:hypothetical protein
LPRHQRCHALEVNVQIVAIVIKNIISHLQWVTQYICIIAKEQRTLAGFTVEYCRCKPTTFDLQVFCYFFILLIVHGQLGIVEIVHVECCYSRAISKINNRRIIRPFDKFHIVFARCKYLFVIGCVYICKEEFDKITRYLPRRFADIWLICYDCSQTVRMFYHICGTYCRQVICISILCGSCLLLVFDFHRFARLVLFS